MAITENVARGFGSALNEAQWVAARIDPTSARVELGFVVLTLPEHGPEPEDRRRILRLKGVSRVVASYRGGRWDDREAAVLPLEPLRLDSVIEDLGQLPIFGWEFIDAGDEQFRQWKDRLSLDLPCAGSGTHTIDLFQDHGQRILDFRAWFDGVEVRDVEGREIPIQRFIDDGVRWWDALYTGDTRTDGHGIVPSRSDS